MRTKEISNTDDMIDSRDVIARIEALTEERDALMEAVSEAEEEQAKIITADAKADREHPETASDTISDEAHDAIQAVADAHDALSDWQADSDGLELKALEALQEEAEGYSPDWKYGASLIADSYFEDYARELAEDIGAIKDDVAWPCTCIDWEKAADELRQDYTSVEFDGVTYLVR